MPMRALGAIALWLTACSAGPGPVADAGFDAGVVVSPIELCDRLARARCGLVARCYAAFAREPMSLCVASEQARCYAANATLQSAFDSERVVVSAARLERCEQRAATSACPPSFPPGYAVAAAVPLADCTLETGLLVGTGASGVTCEHAVECGPGTTCVKPGGVCRGTCSSWPTIGEACAFGCAPGLVCDDQATSGTEDDRCGDPKGAGERCTTSGMCQASLRCVAGECVALAKLGEPCTYDAERLSPCEPGLACDVAPFVAGAQGRCVVPRAMHQKCRFHWSCAPGLVCADLDFEGYPQREPTEGFCRAPAAEGTNCAATPYQAFVGDQCEAGTGCSQETMKCRANPGRGEACTPSEASCSGVDTYCKPAGSGDVGTCTGPAGLGERCVFELDAQRRIRIPCTSGACDLVSTLTCRPPTKALNNECTEDGECTSGRCAVQQDRTLRCAPPC